MLHQHSYLDVQEKHIHLASELRIRRDQSNQAEAQVVWCVLHVLPHELERVAGQQVVAFGDHPCVNRALRSSVHLVHMAVLLRLDKADEVVIHVVCVGYFRDTTLCCLVVNGFDLFRGFQRLCPFDRAKRDDLLQQVVERRPSPCSKSILLQ